MAHHTQLCIVLFGTCLFSIFLLLECRKLKGYEFPVYSTKKCPGNQAEWKNRSSAINCTDKNGYMCTPNENFTDLLEFCYIYPRILVKEDLCLYLDKRVSRVNSYNCRKFTHGCPELNYFSSETYVHLSCMEIENGCFAAEPSCKRQPLQRKTSIDDTTLAIILGVSIPASILCILCILVFYLIRKKIGFRRRRRNTVRGDEETELLLGGYEQREPIDNNEESSIEKAVFDQWEQDDIDFISTKACEEVENMIKSRNLVIVSGHSGSGKSAIIQHIALNYREQGWIVKRVNKVEDIVNEYYHPSLFRIIKTIFVFNNPFGKESFDEILSDSWQTYEEELKVYLTTAKLLMSCRSHIISDTRVAHHLVNQAAIVDIDNEKYKFSVDEKRQILTKYTPNMNLSYTDCNEILAVERYFPLLCKLYSSKEEYRSKGKSFFTKPVTVLKKELKRLRKNDKRTYCALALLVLFNDDLCLSDLLRDKDTKKKFKHTLKLCGLPKYTLPSKIWGTFESLKGFFVKSIGDTYHFYHDLVMEVTTHVFVNDYPVDTIKYADIGFFKSRVRLGDCEEHNDPLTIYLSDNYIDELGERFFNELFGNRLMDVVLNPCLKNKKVIETLKKEIQKHPEKLPMLLQKKQLKFNKKNYNTAKHLHLTKLAFMGLTNDLSPLFVLIVHSHTDLSLECLDTLTHVDFKGDSLLHAVYCNGSMQLFQIFSKDQVKESLTNVLGGFSPVHVVSAFHNYEILEKLFTIGADVNSISHTWDHLTPLSMAAGNNNQEYECCSYRETGAHRRDITVQLLLDNGADIDLCAKDGASPLHLACQNGHDSTVQLLLNNGADIDLCAKDRASPLHMACQYGHDSTVKLLLVNEVHINFCKEDGSSPLFIACRYGHESTVKLLLSNGADINLCDDDGASPLYIACKIGHDNIVSILLECGSNINLCAKDETSPLYIACKNGYDSTVQLLLSNGADINLCDENGCSPLYTACQNGHDSTVKLLLTEGAAVINLRANDGASPLFIACRYGHDSTVKHLLSNGASIYLCTKVGASPLHIACRYGHDSTVQLLLSNGADINLCDMANISPLYSACLSGHDSLVQHLLCNGALVNVCTVNGVSPLYIACKVAQDSIVQLLLRNGADINLCATDGTSPLHIACQNGDNRMVQLLLDNGADINLCKKDGASPLYIAYENGPDSILQLLLSKGADINSCAKNGTSLLHRACQNGHNRMVQLLLDNGADINLCKKNGASPLYIACQIGHERTVQLLLSNGADINRCLDNGISPLYIACQIGHDRTVQLLLSNGADINRCLDNGISPLYIACQNGYDRTVHLLLNNGANINLCMNDGVSPLYIAFEKRQYKTVNILLNNGADTSLACGWKVNPDLVDFYEKQDSTIVFLQQKDNISNNLYDPDSYFSLFVSCQMERVTRMIL